MSVEVGVVEVWLLIPSEVPCLEGVGWWRGDYSLPRGPMSGGGGVVEVWLLTPRGPMSGGGGDGGVITHPSEVPCLWEWWRCDYSPLWGPMSGGGGVVEVWLLTPLRSPVGVGTHPRTYSPDIPNPFDIPTPPLDIPTHPRRDLVPEIPTPRKDMGPEIPIPLWTNRHLWKHYLPQLRLRR